MCFGSFFQNADSQLCFRFFFFFFLFLFFYNFRYKPIRPTKRKVVRCCLKFGVFTLKKRKHNCFQLSGLCRSPRLDFCHAKHELYVTELSMMQRTFSVSPCSGTTLVQKQGVSVRLYTTLKPTPYLHETSHCHCK